jgi:hypothetical protein
MADDHIERIPLFLSSHGITTFHFERLARHRAVIIRCNGRAGRVVFPITGSHWCRPANTISTIRHVLGVLEAKTATGYRGRPVRRPETSGGARYVSRALVGEAAVPRPDTNLEPLVILKARLDAATAAAEATGEGVSAAGSPARGPVRGALPTPWLGRQTRHLTV